ncbi:MAG: MFS transporter [Candidatus Bathyarchaeota archaeon]|nr:MFS transporter [Candidatus Bathyarchaeota archaeon]
MPCTDENTYAEPCESNPSRIPTRLSWISAVFPFYIALGPVGTFVQLYILELGGSVVDVSLAVTLYNLVSIPSLMLWGFVTDRIYKRRPMIIASFLSTSILLTLFLAARTITSVSLLYALLSLTTSASTTPLNLLIMETEKRKRWASAFARFSMSASAGQTIGLFLGVALSFHLPLTYIVIPLSFFSFASTCLTFVAVKEPPITFERHAIVMDLHSFTERLKAAPYIFLKTPRLTDFKRMFRTLKYELTGYATILYLSIFLFYISSGLFNTSIVPALQSKNYSNLIIFFVTAVVMIAQILSFKYAGHYVGKKHPLKAAITSLILRSACYGLMGVIIYLTSGLPLLMLTLILYPLAGGLAYAIYYTASNITVFHVLDDRHQGSSLGVYSALVGFAMVAGSFISGFASFYLGFHTTFIIASLFLVFSAMLIRRLINHLPPTLW